MQDLIAMLQAAARDEHAAIIQYLRHAYALGEGEEACEIEAIARDEMRHFWMLSRWMVKLGGEPTIERGFVDLAGETPPEWMDRDVEAEERAIAMYRDYIPRITDPALRADIERILADEEAHRGDFAHFAEKFRRPAAPTPATEEQPPEEESAEAPPPPAPADLEALDWGVRHEYAAILQYLFHAFLIRDEDISRQLELQAINEMQHMGWLAEELSSLGREMPLEHHAVALPRELSAMLQADIQLEHETAEQYGKYVAQMEDEELKELVERIKDHELYHKGLFTRFLERINRLTPTGWTVGSLRDKK